MRKAFVLFVLLLGLSVGGVCVAGAAVNSQMDQVEVIAIQQTGDPSVLKDLRVDLQSYYQNLHWDTVFLPGENTVDTTFRYDGQGGNNLYEDRSDIWFFSLEDDIFASMHYDRDAQQHEGLSRAYHELDLQVQPGEKGSREIRVKDYVDYYEFMIEVHTPLDTFIYNTTWRVNEGEKKLVEDFHDFFRIPVLEEQGLQIELTKNPDGSISSLGASPADQGDLFRMSIDGGTDSVVTEDTIYFSFSNRTSDGNIVDTSLIPGGYGIYALPMEADFDPKTGTPFRADKLEMVYPLDKGVRFISLTSSLDQSRLLLNTEENGWYVLTVIDTATMTALQRFELAPLREKGNAFRLWEDDEQDIFIVELFYEEYILFSLEEDGSYTLVLRSPKANSRLDLHDFRSDFAFNGQYLVVGNAEHWKDSDASKQGYFFLSVYDTSGLRYHGEYSISLIETSDDSSTRHPKPTYYDPIVLSWR